MNTPFRSLRFAHVSLTLAGLMWVLPFLHFRHQYPLTTFYQEWWSALLGVMALTLLVTRDFWVNTEIPRIAQLPVALIAVVLLQWGLGKLAYFDQGLLFTLYLLFAALLMMLGAKLRDCFGLKTLAQVLAVFLLVGAELNALVGVLQHYRWNTWLNPVVVVKVSSSVYGNLAQPNHFASYIAFGLASLGFLYQQQRLKAGYVVILAAPLLFVMTLSGSRSSWLYLLLLSGLAWWWARSGSGQRLLRYCLLLLAGFGLMHAVVQLPFMAGVDGSVDTMQRLFSGDTASGGIRLQLWREAGMMFMQHPWLGVGFGQFAWQHFQLLPSLPQNNVAGLYNNAHNLIFQLAAETGVAGLLVLFASLGAWLYGLRKGNAISGSGELAGTGKRGTEDHAAYWWSFAVLGILAIHSLLEYPLWYSYFVAVAAILLGALDETRYRIELYRIGRMAMACILLMGALILVQLSSGYHRLEQVLMVSSASAVSPERLKEVREGLVAVYRGSLLSPYAELFISSQLGINDENIGEKLALNTRVMHFAPVSKVAYRQVLLLVLSGQQEQAKIILVQAIRSYPDGLADALRQMTELADKDPARFSALLEFALQKEQE